MVFILLRSVSLQLFMMQAATNMHNVMTERVIRAKILFFDSNPSGRIISRFSKDIGIIDNVLPLVAVFVTQGLLRALSVVITIAILNPYLIIPALLGLTYMIYISKTGLKSMLESQRLDFLQQGPINQTYTMAITGLITFRAYKSFDFHCNEFQKTLELSANSTFCYNVMNRWIGLRLDMICAFIAIFTSIFCIVFKGKIPSEMLIVSL